MLGRSKKQKHVGLLLLRLWSNIGLSAAQITRDSIQKFPNALTLDYAFNSIVPAYWTGLPHHRRTPFAISPDGSAGYLAYLDASGTGVHVQKVDTKTFAAVGSTVTIPNGKEAGGLVAHDDGFALLTNEAMPSGTANAPPANTPVAALYRYMGQKQSWKAWLGGPNLRAQMGLSMSPDLNGDLQFSAKAGYYGAYFVVTNYQGSAKGHFGDMIQYVNTKGEIKQIQGATSSWGCSHNTGIAISEADAPPFATICAEDHSGIWLNTKTGGMSGTKISHEHVMNGATNEALGGTSGSYASLARFPDSPSYLFTWVSRGATNLTADKWLPGSPSSQPRWKHRNVALAVLKDKSTLASQPATARAGAAEGDKNVQWLTSGASDTANAHVATLNAEAALATWEELSDPQCPCTAMGCSGTFTGTRFQLLDRTGKAVGAPYVTTDLTVSGDFARTKDGRTCWPYVEGPWNLKAGSSAGRCGSITAPPGRNVVKKMSFACVSVKS